MKTKQLRELTEQELEQQLRDSMDALVNLRMQAATSELENNQAIRRVRKDISKVKTLLREAELKREKESGREG
jgi:large subunit ribosomal protein L29